MGKRRYGWIDRWKGILIFLVVLGHVVGGVTHFATGDAQLFMRHWYKFIYSFHMAAFFVLAGITFSGVREGWRTFITKKFKRLMVPYLVFGIASLILFSFVMSRFASSTADATDSYYAEKASLKISDFVLGLLHGGGWPNGEGLRFNSVLWFLPCMFACELIYAALDRFIRGWTAVLWAAAFFAIHYVVSNWVPIPLPWGLGRAFSFLPYMIFGHLVCRAAPIPSVEHLRLVKVGLFAVVPLLWLLVMQIPDCYWYESGCWALVTPIITLLVVLWSGALAQAFPIKGLAWLGLCSMGIMLMHKFPVMALQFGCAPIRWAVSASLVGAVGISILLSIVVSVLCGVLHQTIRKVAPWMIGG